MENREECSGQQKQRILWSSGLGRACYILATERPVWPNGGEQEGKYNREGWRDGQDSGLVGPCRPW